eukprot:CAMPEP_0172328906 /NCGR_PEP_ID=MMETSP1058-20130122/60598_1 /TAXON_ID=83371 /ORGANISM="Detonula confervacea, Strain CCMP 353" /LENGTH=983 /DNA_ID=CAMNT_0013046043 /DNA_START=66 /DNA_END=3017 /DNA_ORIENTATION=+
MDPQPSSPEDNVIVEVTASSTASNAPDTDANVTTATAKMKKELVPHASSASATIDDNQSQQDASVTFPKQTGNAWGITKSTADAETADSTPPQSMDKNTNNTKKRANIAFLPGDSTADDTGINSNINGSTLCKPKFAFADIIAEQESEKNIAKPSSVSFSKDVESEEERMMRLAIEASLQDQHDTSHGFQSHATKMPASVLKNACGDDTGKATSFPPKSSHDVSFSKNNIAYDEDDGMDDDMRMAIALSLQEAEGRGGNNSYASTGAGAASSTYGDSGGVKDDNMDVEDDRKPSSLPPKEEAMGLMEDNLKPAAVEMGSDSANVSERKSNHSDFASYPTAASAASACTSSAYAAASSVAFAAAAATSSPPNDESEKLAQALHQAELSDYNASKTANAEAESASLQLALQLQKEEDARLTLERGADAARLRREEMCHGGGGGSVGVRTVGRDEFNSLKTDKDYDDGRVTDRRKYEERGVGKLLSSKNFYGDEEIMGDGPGKNDDGETDDYYYYENDRLKGDDTQQDYDLDGEDDDDGIRMNSQSSSSTWKRLDRDTFIGPNNEIRTKHDPELKHRSNAVNLLGSHGAKDAYSHNGGSSDNNKSVSISDRAYNAFCRAESRQSGFKKGVAKQGHGRAENMNAGKTRGGAMDGSVRLQIAAAINAGLIDKCNGCVKEGKEALVYHADGGWKGRQAISEENSPVETLETTGSDGYDVAVKVFKRVVEFKGRGTYVDGDPRYHKQKFKTNDQRDQVVLWAEKERRNLVRAHRAGIAVPKPLYQKENVLFMRFLGENGWPSPQLKEIDMKKGSKKWTTLYCQTLVAVRRLYHCARLVHTDLSEYNLLICPSWQASHDHFTASDKRNVDDETLQVVLIDFGMAVDIGHPSAPTWLRRDLSTVRDFFVKQGIKTLSNEDAEEFVTDPVDETNNDVKDDIEANDEETSALNERHEDTHHLEASQSNNWRHTKRGWDDKKDTEELLNKLRGSS